MMLDRELDYASQKIYDSKKTLDKEWKVFSDRVGVKYYKDAKFKNEISTVGGIGTKLTVLKESNEGVLVQRNGESLGWVRKSECVVWNNPLVRHSTAVDIKAFIVNTQDADLIKNIEKTPEIKDVYKIYGSPSSSTKLDQQRIYQVLFVYKYDKETNRYLLSNNYKLSGDGQLLGWVDGRRVKVWDTSIALEPNWNEESRKERGSDQDLVARVFRTFKDAKEHREGGNVKALITRDPAALELEEYSDLIHPSGRYKGDVPRFPYFTQSGGIINCGSIGKVNVSSIDLIGGSSDYEFNRMRQELENREKNQYNTNVVFLVDGTRGMIKHMRTTVPQAVDRINAAMPAQYRGKLKFGLVVYVDGVCSSSSRASLIRKKIELTNEQDVFKKATASTRIFTQDDGDIRAAMHYGLKTALEGVGMKRYENNVIVHIGRAEDFSYDRTRSHCDEPPYVDTDMLYQSLSNYRPAFISIQTDWDNTSRGHKGFEKDSKNLMMETARFINENEKEKLLSVGLDQTITVDSEMKETYTEIINAPSLMRVYYPDRTQAKASIEPSEVVNLIEASFDESLKRSQEQIGFIKALYHDNSVLSDKVSEFGEVFASSLAGMDPEMLALLASERVHLFSEAYTYKKHKLARHDSYQHVLFLKYNSVAALERLFQGIDNASDLADVEGQKDYLKSALTQYAKSMLNIDELETSEVQIKDLRRQITGVIDDTGIGNKNDILSRLSSFDEIDELSTEEVKSLFSDLSARGQKFLKEINTKGGYPFTYHAGVGNIKSDPELEFFWLPIEYLF